MGACAARAAWAAWQANSSAPGVCTTRFCARRRRGRCARRACLSVCRSMRCAGTWTACRHTLRGRHRQHSAMRCVGSIGSGRALRWRDWQHAGMRCVGEIGSMQACTAWAASGHGRHDLLGRYRATVSRPMPAVRPPVATWAAILIRGLTQHHCVQGMASRAGAETVKTWTGQAAVLMGPAEELSGDRLAGQRRGTGVRDVPAPLTVGPVQQAWRSHAGRSTTWRGRLRIAQPRPLACGWSKPA